MVSVIQTSLTGISVRGGGVNTLCFSDQDDSNVDNVVDRVADFWAAIMARCTKDVTAQVQSEVRRYAAVDGSLQDIISVGSHAAVQGGVELDPVPPASQALIRLKTGSIVRNRQVQGRIYVPGIPGSSINGQGQVSDQLRGFFQTAVDELIGDVNGIISVWSRPRPGVPGSESLVTSADVWREAAVLRSRRD